MVAGVSMTLAACSTQPQATEMVTPKKDIGLQLYSIRQLIGSNENFAANQEKVLADLAAMGYTTVEAANYGNGKIYGLAPEDFKACVEKAGLKALSTHASRSLSAEELKAGAANEETMKWWDECIAAHKAAGVEYIVNPWQNVPETLKDLKVWCDYHNAVGKKCAEAGLKFGYHNHSHEFINFGGKTIMDLLVEKLDPTCTSFVLDTYWVQHGGGDVRYWIEKLAGRIDILHLKEMGRNNNGPFITEVGNGNIWWEGVLETAEKAGVKHYVVEQDSWPGDPFDSIAQSAAYLKKFVK